MFSDTARFTTKFSLGTKKFFPQGNSPWDGLPFYLFIWVQGSVFASLVHLYAHYFELQIIIKINVYKLQSKYTTFKLEKITYYFYTN